MAHCYEVLFLQEKFLCERSPALDIEQTQRFLSTVGIKILLCFFFQPQITRG